MKKDLKLLGFVCSKIAEAFRKHDVSYIYTGFNWWSDNDIPYGYIIVTPTDINEVVKAIQELPNTISLREFVAFSA